MFRNAILMTVPLLLLFFILAEAGTAPLRVGGRCEYARYSGEARIISIVEKNEDRYEVKFLFTPRTQIKAQPPLLLTEKREFLMLIDNSIYPDGAYLKRNGIVADKIFDCDIKVIIKGTCTPVLFEFPSMISVSD
jgi:hypothetical protein